MARQVPQNPYADLISAAPKEDASKALKRQRGSKVADLRDHLKSLPDNYYTLPWDGTEENANEIKADLRNAASQLKRGISVREGATKEGQTVVFFELKPRRAYTPRKSENGSSQ